MHKKMHLYTNQYTQMQNETNFEGASGTATKDIWTLLAPLDTNVRWAFTRLYWLDIFTAAVAPLPITRFQYRTTSGRAAYDRINYENANDYNPPPYKRQTKQKKKEKAFGHPKGEQEACLDSRIRQ